MLGITRRKNSPLRLERPDASFTFWEDGHIFSSMTVDAGGYPPKRQSMLPARALPWLLLLYCGASLLHFAHNAEYLADYPNLPAWISRAAVYFSWCAISAIGLCGYFPLPS